MKLTDLMNAFPENDNDRLSAAIYRLAAGVDVRSDLDTANLLVSLAQKVQTQELKYIFEIQKLNFFRQHNQRPFDLPIPHIHSRLLNTLHGLRELFDFDLDRYCQANPDAKTFRGGPRLHYVAFGRQEDRLAYRKNGTALNIGWLVSNLLGHSTCFVPESIPQVYRQDALRLVAAHAPKISVIIPTWNRKEQIFDAIFSAYLQSVQPLEIMVVDDGSSDGTFQAVQTKFSEIIQNGALKLFQRPHLGVSAARNFGLSQAQGDIIAYLDSDNRWESDHLLYAAAGLLQAGKGTVLYTGQIRHNLTDGYSDTLYRPYDQQQLELENYIDLNTVVHYRQAYEDFGGFDENMTRLVDWDLLCRYSKHLQMVSMPVLSSHYMLEKSVLKNISFTEDYQHNLQAMKQKQSRPQ